MTFHILYGISATTLEVLTQFGETADDEQFLLRRGGVDLFVLENPCVAVRDEDGVQAGR